MYKEREMVVFPGRSRIRRALSLLTMALLPLMSASALAQWSLDNEASTLSFVTIKADHVAEAHTFDQLSGSLSRTGELNVEILLSSVNTLIPIRNERMQAMLFETNVFPAATVSAEVNVGDLAGMSAGSQRQQAVPFTLNMHGMEQTYTADVMITRLSGGLQATTLKPILVTAEQHGLVSGVDALREVAGLPSISRAVPVTFSLTFTE
jgi:polyisoprenoid-binding protein YceI